MYNTRKIIKTLEVLGFNIREPDAGTSAYCMHKVSGDEIWLTTAEDERAEDTLERIFAPVELPMQYFKGVYMGLKSDIVSPSDQQ